MFPALYFFYFLSLKGDGDRCTLALGLKYLQVTSHNRYVLIAERDASQKSCKSVQLKGVCHQRADMYRQNFQLIFRN